MAELAQISAPEGLYLIKGALDSTEIRTFQQFLSSIAPPEKAPLLCFGNRRPYPIPEALACMQSTAEQLSNRLLHRQDVSFDHALLRRESFWKACDFGREHPQHYGNVVAIYTVAAIPIRYDFSPPTEEVYARADTDFQPYSLEVESGDLLLLSGWNARYAYTRSIPAKKGVYAHYACVTFALLQQ